MQLMLVSTFFFFLKKTRNKKNQSAAADKMKLAQAAKYDQALVQLTDK